MISRYKLIEIKFGILVKPVDSFDKKVKVAIKIKRV
jgi:hypothetical protein